jgi:hypothetical protein
VKPSPPQFAITCAVVLSLSCAFVTQSLPGGAARGAFSAEAASPVSVDLEWNPVSGATGYRIEVGFEGVDFFPLDEVAGDQSSYTDFVLPGVTDLTYRLVAVTEAGESEVGTSAVNLPPLTPDPVTVTVKLFEPTIVPLPTYDPNNPMGSFPPGFDPEHPEDFDPSSLMQQVSAVEEIGPEGGRLSVTAPDQVTYTLDIPAGAVAQPIFFTLTPVASIDGWPLSGGLLGAVRIQPEGMSYDVPAILNIDRPSASTNASAPLTVGFAVSPFSRELYLHPLLSASETSSHQGGGGPLAAGLPGPAAQGGSTSMAVGGGGTFGTGAGSSADVQRQAQRVPTDSGEQVAQHNAQQQFARPEAQAASLNETGASILIQMVSADSASQVDRVASQLEQYWQDGGPKYNASLNAQLLQSFISKIKTLVTRSKGDCLTRDDLVAADLATKLSQPESDFWRSVADAYKTKFGVSGQTLLDDLVKGKAACRITLEFTSTVRLDPGNGWLMAEVKTVTPIQLQHDRIGATSSTSYRMSGYGSATYVRYEYQGTKGCPIVKVTQYPTVPIYVTGLFPEFDNAGRLANFSLMSWELGSGFPHTVDVTTSQDRKGCELTVGITGGGDLWSGSFVLLHYADGVKDWDLGSGGYPLVFTKRYVNYSVSIPGGAGKVTETATYTITIRRGDGG